MDKEAFIEALSQHNIILNERQLKQFDDYYHLLIETNKVMNLTNITDEKEVYLKHFYDSLTPSFDYTFNDQSLCDVGAGAGFPSIPLKIIYPDLKITIIDSLNKRINFLNTLIDTLGLTDVKAIHARAEDYALNHREIFDLVTARAVARLNILDELCLPLTKVNGTFIALKGKLGLEELKEAKKGIEILGGKVNHIQEFDLINSDHRINIFINKSLSTPSKYPRNYGKIKKNPL